jgi:hypothetical protein
LTQPGREDLLRAKSDQTHCGADQALGIAVFNATRHGDAIKLSDRQGVDILLR